MQCPHPCGFCTNRVLRCVCVCVRAPLVPLHSWLGCAVSMGMFVSWPRLRPATPGWGAGVCLCALLLYPAIPGWGVLCGCVCFGSGFGCAPPLLPRALGSVCLCVRTALVTRHPWLECAVWVCVLGFRFRLRPATPGWGVWVCVCVCVRAPPVPRHSWLRFVVCWLGVAWHLFLCPGSCRVVRAALVCGTRWPLLLGTCPCAFVVAGGVPPWRAFWPRVGTPRLIRSGRSRCSGWLCRRRGAFPHPGSLHPRIYWAASRGTWKPAENRTLCACRWLLPRQGLWARLRRTRSGPRDGVVPGGSFLSVLGCVRCGLLLVWTRSLTRPGFRTARLLTGDSAGAPGLFRVDADTAHFGSQDTTPGSRACARVRALLGLVGRAGLLGAFWCGSPFPVAGLGALFVCSAPSVLGLPCLWLSSGFFFPLFFFSPCCATAVSCVPCFPGRGALGLGVLWSSAPPLFSLLFSICFFFASPCLLCSVDSGPPCRGPWRSVVLPRGLLFVFFFVFLLPPPPFFLLAVLLFFVCFLFLFFFPFSAAAFFFSALVCRLCGSWAGWCVLGCGVSWCVLLWALCPGGGRFALVLCRWVLPGCARSVCVVASRVAVLWCVVCFCLVLCGVPVLGLVLAPRCCPLLPSPGPLSWPVVVFCRGLRCCVSPVCRVSCGVLLCVPCLAGGAVLFRSRWLVPRVVACGCRLFAAGSGCLLLFPAGVCCRGCSCVAAWLAALLCAVVCCGAPLPCAVSCVLWCCVAVWCHAVAPCCLFSFAGGVGLCFFPVCAVLCCAARRVVWCRFGLRCCWCLVLWCVAVCCGVPLGALWCCGAALVCCCVLLCRALPCGVLRPVLCPAVLRCLVVLCWLAVLCGCLRCWCLLFLLSSFTLLKTPADFPVPLKTF